jgi:hypothetical protein
LSAVSRTCLRDGDVGCVQFAVADDLYFGDGGDLFAHQLKDGAAEVAGDTLVRSGAFELGIQEGMIETLAAGGEAVYTLSA